MEIEYSEFSAKLKKNLCNIDSKNSLCLDFLKSFYISTSDNSIQFSQSELDTEQIWQILNLQNDNVQVLEDTSGLLQCSSKYPSLFTIKTKSLVAEDQKKSSESEREDEEPSSNDEKEVFEENEVKNHSRKSKRSEASQVDDDFFKLSEMEEFLDQEEKENNKKESDINFFEDIPENVNEENEELNYQNFYGEENGNSKDSDIESTSQKHPQSTFEVREERLKRQVQQFEEDLLTEKSWQLQGETNSKKRPLNSLLEEVLEFDSTSRAPLIITETTSEKLEDIIKNRIKSNVFDDVVKKIINKQKQEYSKQIVLDQEKSKESLSTIYEKEYNKEINKGELKEENVKSSYLQSLMQNLFSKLDSLSNFHVTPQKLLEEPKIITNTSTLQVEEVAPVSVSDMNILAPEEVKTKKEILLGNTEKTKTSKKRNRKIKALKYKSKTVDKPKNSQDTRSESNPVVKTSTQFFSKLQSNGINNKNKKPMSDLKSAKKIKL